MKRLLLLTLSLVVAACGTGGSRKTIDVQYLHDARTDLCFATRYGGLNTSSYVMVVVPCTSAVLALTR